MTDIEKRAAYTNARTEMREAEEDLHSAVVRLRSAAFRLMRCEADMSSDPLDTLLSIASQNTAESGGGYSSPSNIIQNAKRHAAFEAISWLVSRR